MQRILKNMEPIFQPGLTLNTEYNEFEEMAYNAKYWHLEYNKLNTKPFTGSLKLFHTSHSQIAEGFWSTDIVITGENPKDSLVLLLPVTPNPVKWMGESANENNMVIIKNKNNIDYQTFDECKMILVSINPNLLEPYWQSYHNESFIDKIKNENKLNVRDLYTKNMLINCWYELLNIGINGNQNSYNEALGARIDQILINSLLESFTNQTETISKQKSVRAAKLARDYIFANFDKPISIMDLCMVTNASKRSLYYGFKSLYGYSPYLFIKRMKLNFARYELLRANKSVTVTEVAYNWNFYHLSRFAIEYYNMFGEKPSDTLKRSI